jgi:hypothetical protein
VDVRRRRVLLALAAAAAAVAVSGAAAAQQVTVCVDAHVALQGKTIVDRTICQTLPPG